MKSENTLKYILWFGGALVVLVVIWLFASSSASFEPPKEFLNARENAAVVSQKIVQFTTFTNEKIKSVNLSDLRGERGKALSLIREARESNRSAYNEAFELSQELKRLAESLGSAPRETQRLAYEAVAIELSLVSEFILYTQHLNTFLEDLSRAIAVNSIAAREKAENSLREVNARATKINELNREFSLKIREFDQEL